MKKITAIAVGLCLLLAMVPAYAFGADDAWYIDADGTRHTAPAATQVSDGDTQWSDEWYIVSGQVTLSARVQVQGSVNLILADGATLNATQGIQVPAGSQFTVYAQSTGQDMGALLATGKSEPYSNGVAGIGGNKDGGGTIIINGGSISAEGDMGAGIGGAESGWVELVQINGGTVVATGSENGAGIGNGGYDSHSHSATIQITGGNVTAVGSSTGAGIGGGRYGDGGDIQISGGTIVATGGYSAAAMGGGNSSNGNFSICISGGTVTAISNSSSAAAIGAGSKGGKSTFTTGQNGSAVIMTQSSVAPVEDTSSQDSWNCILFDGANGTVYGDVASVESFDIPAGYTLQVQSGHQVTIGSGIVLDNLGQVQNDGEILVNIGGTYKGSMPTGNVLQCQIGWDIDGDKTPDETQYLPYGSPLAYGKDEPKKAADVQYTYTFAGWFNGNGAAPATVDGAGVYSAQFDAHEIQYTIALSTGQGYTLQGDTTAPYGSTVVLTLNIADGYAKGSDFALLANGTPLTPGSDGRYTVQVLGNVDIQVVGVVPTGETQPNVTAPNTGDNSPVVVWLALAGATAAAAIVCKKRLQGR